MDEREKERQKNREAMPETAKFLDEWTAVFGKPTYGKFTENGKTVEWGKRTV